MKPSLRPGRRWLFSLLALLFAGVWLGAAWRILAQPVTRSILPVEQARALTTVNSYSNCRFGLDGPAESYSVTQLNLGWYMDWGASLSPTHPNGAEYVQVVRPKYDSGAVIFDPPTTTLYAIIDQNPGALWLIGNEPDSPGQDNLRPDDYARGYHRVYSLIKARDPSARAGAGNIVQPTPLRMQYLDRVLQAYQQAYHQPLPADVWSVHSYILREISPYDPEAYTVYDVWGADIPPGLTVTRGLLYSYSQMFNTSIFQQRLIDFRQWMRDRGYQDTPLYITEFGTLFPYPPYSISEGEVFTYYDELGQPMTEARTTQYMTKTFNILQSLANPATGYPVDSYRLVQRWLWYSVDDPQFGGLLFDPVSGVRRPLGDVFSQYTGAISPSVDWIAVRAWAEPMIQAGGLPVTATLHAQIGNGGNISSSKRLTVTFYSGSIGQPGTQVIASQTITPNLPGCGSSVILTASWPALTAGSHLFMVQVRAADADLNLSNNVTTGTVLVATKQLWLPLISRMN